MFFDRLSVLFPQSFRSGNKEDASVATSHGVAAFLQGLEGPLPFPLLPD